jgi:hypothetical protein
MSDENVFNDLNMLDEHLHGATVRMMGARGLRYSEAMEQVARENPALTRLREGLYRQREANAIDLKVYRSDGKVVDFESQIEALTVEAIAANPGMGRGQALKLVAAGNRELFHRRESARQAP